MAASNMLGMRRPGSGCRVWPQKASNVGAHGGVADVAVAGQLVRERAHVARTLHVVLAAQRVHAHAVAPEVAGDQRKVGHAHHHRAALAVLGDAEAVVDGTVATRRVQAGGGAHFGGRHAGVLLERLGAVLRLRHERRPLCELGGVAALLHEAMVHQILGDDDVRERVDDGHVGARPQLQEVLGRHVRALHEIDAARVDHDELGAVTQPTLHARGEHRVRIGGVGADQQDDIGELDRLEVLRAGRRAERLRQAEARGRVAHTGARVDVVVAERGADHLLHHEHFFVGAARRRDAADGADTVASLDVLQPGGGEVDGFLPRDHLPLVGDGLADHRVQLTIGVAGVAPGETALHARVAFVGATALVRGSSARPSRPASRP
jgi:hypothetical protein